MEKHEKKVWREFARPVLLEDFQEDLPTLWSVADEVEISFPAATGSDQRALQEALR